jgi:hypothetical protein
MAFLSRTGHLHIDFVGVVGDELKTGTFRIENLAAAGDEAIEKRASAQLAAASSANTAGSGAPSSVPVHRAGHSWSNCTTDVGLVTLHGACGGS